MIRTLLPFVVVFFSTSELVLAALRRSRRGSAQRDDRGSMLLLWISIAAAMFLAVAATNVPAARITWPVSILDALTFVVLVVGLVLRWTAILTLGKFFTVDVAIHSDHSVVQSGLYRYMRHPSYTGLLIAFLGVGLFLGNWLSLVALLVPIVLGVLWRVAQEEKVLRESLGAVYESYCARTKRFVPGVF